MSGRTCGSDEGVGRSRAGSARHACAPAPTGLDSAGAGRAAPARTGLDSASAGRAARSARAAPVAAGRAARGPRRAAGPARGFAIVAAIFLLVVLALLGAMIVALSSTQQVGQARDLLGSRAYFAARAGIEWGVYQALRNASCSASSALPALAGSAQGFTVQVNCSASGPFDEGGTTVRVYQLTSTATRGTPGALDHVDRQLQAVVSTP